MGNMANMSINRWGSNLFWFNQFFSNLNAPSLFQKFLLLDQWFPSLFKYGISLPNYIRKTTRWGSRATIDNFKYFRNVTKLEPLPNEKQKYRIRLPNDDLLFPSFWFFRFQHALICFINFFHLGTALEFTQRQYSSVMQRSPKEISATFNYSSSRYITLSKLTISKSNKIYRF